MQLRSFSGPHPLLGPLKPEKRPMLPGGESGRKGNTLYTLYFLYITINLKKTAEAEIYQFLRIYYE